MDAAQLADVRAITDASAAVDGVQPLDEGAWRRLTHHADALKVRLEPGAGFTVADGALLHLVVAPEQRDAGVGGRLLAAALDDRTARRAWSHGDHPAAARLAERFGFSRVRELWVMRRALDGQDTTPARAPADAHVRSFRRGDEAEVLRVNAAAFAGHPEQGGMDEGELAERMAETWFDPAGLLLAVDGERLLGFHWTKRHSPTLGEVYVMAIDTSARRLGLGRVLVNAGLAHLQEVGVTDVLLYVESDSVAAVKLYEALGFTHAPADTHVMYAREASEQASE